MDLTFDSTEADLQQELRRFLVATIDADRRRAIAAQPGAVDRELWKQLADMGVFSISLPEEAGGIGLGLAHAVDRVRGTRASTRAGSPGRHLPGGRPHRRRRHW